MSYCSICPRITKCIEAHGPVPSMYMAIGEAPGKFEDISGIPFVGDAGQEWDNIYLPLAGLSRGEMFVTNVRQCRPHQNRKPTAKEIEVCGSHHLPDELQSVKPSVVFLLGSTACSLIEGINVEVEHGIPRKGNLFGNEYWVVPMFHPALGLHQTSAMIEMLEDWEGLRPWLEDEFWAWPTGGFLEDYELIETVADIKDYFLYQYVDLIAVDTESHVGVPWSIQFSNQPGTGRMVLLHSRQLAYKVGSWLADAMRFNNSKLVLHNAPADLPIIESLVHGPVHQYIDTMQEAYQLGNLPQGLKALGYRLCGVRMNSWEEVVGEASKVKLMDWMTNAIMEEWLHPIVETKQLKTRLKTIEKPNGIEAALRRILAHTIESPTYDPWERLEGLGLSGMPMKGIANCRLEDAVQYGCRDADITLRVALRLQELRREAELKWNVLEEDQDV